MPPVADLVRAAREARSRSHAPYSEFAMGAAALAGGTVTVGCLVENVSLGLAMCAERVAMFSTVVAGAGPLEAVALVAPRTDGEITLPCGACLQVAVELGGFAVEIVASDLAGEVVSCRLSDLAPALPSKRKAATQDSAP